MQKQKIEIAATVSTNNQCKKLLDDLEALSEKYCVETVVRIAEPVTPLDMFQAYQDHSVSKESE